MFLKALFLAVKEWKQPKFPSNAKEIDNCAKAKGSVFWSSDMNSALIGKVPGAKKDKRAEGEVGIRGWDGWMASQMQWTWTQANSGDGEGQGGLACCSPRGRKEQDMTRWQQQSFYFHKMEYYLVIERNELLVYGIFIEYPKINVN